MKKENSLDNKRPDLLKYWNYKRNGNLISDKVTCGSNKKVWWQCSKNPEHEWVTHIKNRTKPNGNGCPHCKSKKKQY